VISLACLAIAVKQIGLEAGPLSQWLHAGLKSRIRCHSAWDGVAALTTDRSVSSAELAVDDAGTLDLLKRWQEDLVLFSDVDAIARPQPHCIATLLGDEAEAIPLSLEGPPVAVERVVDQRREHRSKSGIHPFSFTLARCLGQGPQRSPPRGEPAIRDKLVEVCWIVRSMAFPIPPPPVARMAADRPAGKPEVGMGKRMALRLVGSPSRRAELDTRRHQGEGAYVVPHLVSAEFAAASGITGDRLISLGHQGRRGARQAKEIFAPAASSIS
jgi:hypothetical protein